MRKIWIGCGWVLLVAGIVLTVTMGLVWLGGGKTFKMISPIAMGCLFILLGRNFIVRGRSLSSDDPAGNPAATKADHVAARRMIAQAVWVGGFIILAVAFVVGVLIFLPCP